MSLGQRIQERREELGITRAELARRLGVTSTAVANYEGGKNALREDLLLKLFQVLDVDPNYLYQDALMGQAFHFLSPLVPFIYLLMDKTEITLAQYQGYIFKWCIGIFVIFMAMGFVTGSLAILWAYDGQQHYGRERLSGGCCLRAGHGRPLSAVHGPAAGDG